MSWSPDKPTEPGWWWLLDQSAEPPAIDTVYVVEVMGELIPAYPGSDLNFSHACWDGCLFVKATPPPLPGEAT